MKRAPQIAAGCVLLAMVVAARADDFWRRKPPEQWTAEEAIQVLRNSPWAKQETAAAPPLNCDPDDYDEFGNCRDPRFRVQRNPARQQGVEVARFNGAVYLVRWDSAPEVVAAFARLESLGERASAAFQSPPPRRPADRYVITMNVVQPAQNAGDPFLVRENTREKKPVRLKTSRGTYVPLETQRSGVGASEAIHYFFPRVQDGTPILDEKGDTAEFAFEGAKVSLKCKFTLEAESLRDPAVPH